MTEHHGDKLTATFSTVELRYKQRNKLALQSEGKGTKAANEQTYHGSDAPERSGMGHQARQSVLLSRPLHHMSVVRHHDGHLLHHLHQGAAGDEATRTHERGGADESARSGVGGAEQPAGWSSTLRAKEVTGSQREPLVNQAPPPPQRVGGAAREGEGRTTHLFVSLSLSLSLPRSPSVTLEVCDRGASSPLLSSSRSPTPLHRRSRSRSLAASLPRRRSTFSARSLLAAALFSLASPLKIKPEGGGEDGWVVGVFTRVFLTEIGRRKSSDQPQ